MPSVFDCAVRFIHSPVVDNKMVETWTPRILDFQILEFLETVIVQLDAQLSSSTQMDDESFFRFTFKLQMVQVVFEINCLYVCNLCVCVFKEMQVCIFSPQTDET